MALFFVRFALGIKSVDIYQKLCYTEIGKVSTTLIYKKENEE